MTYSRLPWSENYDAPATPTEYERDARRFGFCDECGKPIYEGDEYFQVGDCRFCYNCVEFRVAGE